MTHANPWQKLYAARQPQHPYWLQRRHQFMLKQTHYKVAVDTDTSANAGRDSQPACFEESTPVCRGCGTLHRGQGHIVIPLWEIIRLVSIPACDTSPLSFRATRNQFHDISEILRGTHSSHGMPIYSLGVIWIFWDSTPAAYRILRLNFNANFK